MGELKWICPKCANEETVVLHAAERPDGWKEFVYEDKIVYTTKVLKIDDVVLLCPVCGKLESVRKSDYVDICAKTMREKAAGGTGGTPTSTSSIAVGVAIGVIVGSLILYMIVGKLFF